MLNYKQMKGERKGGILMRSNFLKLLGLSVALAFVAGVVGNVDVGRAGLAQQCDITLRPGSSIQQAITNASPGNVLCLQAGTWWANLEINKSLTLRGAGSRQTVIKSAQTGYPVILIESDSEIEVRIEDLTLTQASGGRCAVEDPKWICPHGIQVRGKAKTTIINSTVSRNAWNGLAVGGSATLRLVNSTILGNGEDGLSVSDSAMASLRNSTISGNGDGLVVSGSAQVELQENRIIGNRGCGIHVFTSGAQMSGTPNEIHDNGADLCGFAPSSLRKPLVGQTSLTQISVPNDYASVQEAIDAIAPGGTIEVAAGNFEANLTIWKPLTLRGAGTTQTTLQGKAGRTLAVSIIAEARGVKLEGLTVTGSGDGLLIYGDVELKEIQSSGNSRNGLVVYDLATASLVNSTVSGNRWNDLVATGQATVSLQDSSVLDNGLTGVFVEGPATVSVLRSTITRNRGDGFAVGGSPTIRLEDSIVSDNEEDGLGVGPGSNVILVNSTVSRNQDDGLWVYDSARVELHGSTIEDNGTATRCRTPIPHDHTEICNGLEVSEKAHVELQDTTIRNNADWGIAARLKKCGYSRDDFAGTVLWQGRGNRIGGNPQGDVCLP